MADTMSATVAARPLTAASDNSNAPTPAYHSPRESPELPQEANKAPAVAPQSASKGHAKSVSTSTSTSASASASQAAAVPASTTSSSLSKRPSMRVRARSNSSKLIHRLTSRGTSFDASMSGSPPASPTSEVHKIDKAALSRAKGKYKSGVNWEHSNIVLPTGEVEPFMEVADVSGSPTAERDAILPDTTSNDAMLSVGGTAAAKAYYQNLNATYANVMFPANQRATVDARQRIAAEQAASRSIQPPAALDPRRHRMGMQTVGGFGRHSNGDRMPSLNTAVHALASTQPSSAATSPVMTPGHQGNTLPTNGPPSAWRRPGGLPPLDTNTTAPHANAAGSPTASQATSPKSGGAELTPSQSEAAADQTLETSKSPASSVRSKRRTFLGLTSKSTERLDKGGRRSRRSSVASVSEPMPNLSENPNGTWRRRYQDTRELDLLAAELAREAAIEALGVPQPGYAAWSQTPSVSGSRTPAERRSAHNGGASSGLGLQGVSPVSAPGTGSLGQAGAGGSTPLAPPSRRGSVTGSPHSSRLNSPRPPSQGLDAGLGASGSANTIRPKSPRAEASSPSLGQANNVSNIPTEMLAGLSDGPYPMLPPQDPSPDGAHSGYSTPRRSRMNSSSASVAAGGSAAQGSSKKSILSMSMHDPETEMQGLTKLPKSGRSTPFGSRAPSRNVTPKSSLSKLNEAAKLQQQKQPPPPSLPFASRRRSAGEDTNKSLTSPSSIDALKAPALPTPVQEVSKAQEEEGMFGRSTSAQGNQGYASQSLSRPTTSRSAKQAVLPNGGEQNEAGTRSRHQSSGTTASSLLAAPSVESHSAQAPKPKSRLSFLGSFGRGGRSTKSPAASTLGSTHRASNPQLGAPSANSSESSVGSLPSNVASQRSSTFASQSTGLLDSGTSLTRLTPSTEVSHGGEPTPKQAQLDKPAQAEVNYGAKTASGQPGALSPSLAPRPESTDTTSVRPPSSPDAQVRPNTARQEAGSNAPSAKPSPPKQGTTVGNDTPKRPGNLRRLLSKFGSGGKESKVSTRAPSVPALPAGNGTPAARLQRTNGADSKGAPNRAMGPPSRDVRQGRHTTGDLSSSTNDSRSEDFDVKVVYPSSASVTNAVPHRNNLLSTAAPAVSVTR
ncbi:unnamed protein product [Parajaminaea phylloscopi]